jgi:hypothetical protein
MMMVAKVKEIIIIQFRVFLVCGDIRRSNYIVIVKLEVHERACRQHKKRPTERKKRAQARKREMI